MGIVCPGHGVVSDVTLTDSQLALIGLGLGLSQVGLGLTPLRRGFALRASGKVGLGLGSQFTIWTIIMRCMAFVCGQQQQCS
jgi:hypothetical protein